METLESQFNELIASLAIHAKIGRWGSLESPFYEISEDQHGCFIYHQVKMNTIW